MSSRRKPSFKRRLLSKPVKELERAQERLDNITKILSRHADNVQYQRLWSLNAQERKRASNNLERGKSFLDSHTGRAIRKLSVGIRGIKHRQKWKGFVRSAAEEKLHRAGKLPPRKK